tara:strand:- start:124 stop:297 length:174 start_codon:yes stop_codon:yes gene_type:complete
MTNKAKVLKKYPHAFSLRGPFDPWWRVYKEDVTTEHRIGEGATPALAWKEAARKVKA